MRKQTIIDQMGNIDIKNITVDDVPNISNRYLELDDVLSWLDLLEEVQKNEEVH